MRLWWLGAFVVVIWPPALLPLGVLLVVKVAEHLALRGQLLADRADPLPRTTTRF